MSTLDRSRMMKPTKIHSLSEVFHRFSKDGIIHELEKISLKVILGLLSFLSIQVDVNLQPCGLDKTRCWMNLCQSSGDRRLPLRGKSVVM